MGVEPINFGFADQPPADEDQDLYKNFSVFASYTITFFLIFLSPWWELNPT